MTEAMPFLQNYDITFLRPPPIAASGVFLPRGNDRPAAFAMLRSKAAEGESLVVIGRCGEQVLENNPNCISIFICGDPQFKLNRVMNKLGLNAEQAIEEIRNVDRSRKNYHNYYCDTKWGDARGYDLTVKSNVLGRERTAEMLVGYIRSFMERD